MRTRDAALIRKLCSLGLPAQSLALSLLPALRELIPAHSGGVFWVDDKGQMSGLYAERLLSPEAMATYYERHYKDALEGFAVAFRKRAAESDPISSHSFSSAEQSTSYFREILRPLDAFHVLYGILRHNTSSFAQLSLYRGASDVPFGRVDESALRSLLNYLSRGLFDRERLPPQGRGSIVLEESLGVVTSRGEIIGASAEWKRLVRLAAQDRVNPSQASGEQASMQSFLMELCNAARKTDATRSRVELVRHTAWGRFAVRVFDLDTADGHARQLGLLIRREEPRMLALVRGAGHSPLSPQQREVALLLAQGKTNGEIASALKLSLNTASYHVKQVYAKLDVNDRDTVEETLLGLSHDHVSDR